jgi:hypothetical protein
MDIQFSIKKIARLLLTFWAILIVLGFVAEFCRHILGASSNGFWILLLSLQYEMNLPTWFVSAIELMCALQLTLIAIIKCKAKAPYARRWAFLAATFFYISIDELVEIHEYGSDWLYLSGIFYYSWVIPASILVLVMGTLYFKFVWHLPGQIRFQFILSGALFVGGAIGVEMVLGLWASKSGQENIMWSMITLVEEGMEILGMTLFAIALANYIAHEYKYVRFQLQQHEFDAVALPTPATSTAGFSQELVNVPR